MCLCFKKYAFLEKSVWLEVYHQSDQPEFLYIKWTLCFSVLSHKPHSEQLLLDRKYHIFQTLQFLLTDQTAVVVNFRVAHEIIMCLMKDSRCLLKHANCVDGLPLINCFSTCSESQLTSKCFYVWKVSYFCLMFPFLIGYLKEICRGWSHKKMHWKNVGVQTESTMKADSMGLAQPLVPLYCRGLSAEKILQQCQDTEGELQMIFQLSLWTHFHYHQN